MLGFTLSHVIFFISLVSVLSQSIRIFSQFLNYSIKIFQYYVSFCNYIEKLKEVKIIPDIISAAPNYTCRVSDQQFELFYVISA